MILKQKNDTEFLFNGITLFSYGRNLLNNDIPINDNLLLLLDPLFLTLFEENMNKLCEYKNVKNIYIAFILFEDSDNSMIEEYCIKLQNLFEIMYSSKHNFNFISDVNSELYYLDGHIYRLFNKNADLVVKYEKQIEKILKRR